MYQQKLTDVISDHVLLEYEPVSGRYFGICPFCHGKTRTFSVNNQDGVFFCMACGAFGDDTVFLSKINHNKYGKRKSTPKDRILLEIYDDAAYYYYEALHAKSNPGLTYLLDRGVTLADIDAFGLGYSTRQSAGLFRFLIKKYSQDELMRSGLFLQGKSQPFDLFRNRIMFPIMDENNCVVAFGGRALDPKDCKYINSPESDIFNKRKNLYGYPYRSKQRGNTLLICEGYMDLIAIKRIGFYDSSAVLGTALTEEHIEIISRHYTEVCLAMDSDAPGINAAKRSIYQLIAAGLHVTVADFSPAKDPDEFIKEEAADSRAFTSRIHKAVSSEKFLARYAESTEELIDILLALQQTT